MLPTAPVRAAHRTPLIKFIGRHHPPAQLSHKPQPHPASPSSALPDSFASYRKKAQQHGPLNGGSNFSRPGSYGAIGGHSGSELGKVEPPKGMSFDRSDLPERFRRLTWAEGEWEAVESGGATRVW
ncbi:MAG: hypothetical protein MMC23_005374 [Stictis urceolatum]|nr:hypothetical protein [Stictis urceolata]